MSLRRSLLSLAAAALLSCVASRGVHALPTELVNGSFEATDSLGVPEGWRLGRTTRADGYGPAMHDSGAFEGTRWASLTASSSAGAYGVLLQRLDARPWRGKRVIWTAQLRHEGAPFGMSPGSSSFWVRVDRAGDKPGFFDNMSDRPVQRSAWTRATIVGEVDADAESLTVGLMVNRFGRGGIDDVRMREAPAETTTPAAPRRLAARGLANLVALTKLLGYVRHFHPSDPAAEADWDRFAIESVPKVESATNAAALATALREVFAPYAPGVTIAAGKVPARLDSLPPPPGAVAFRAWRRHGFATKDGAGSYSAERVRRRLSARGPEDDVPRLGSFTATDLGGGVWCRVPHTVYADSAGTLPRPAAAPPATVHSEFWQATAADRSVRIADVMLLWTVLRHFYPYDDVVAVDWDAVLRVALEKAALDRDEGEFTRTLERLVAALQDGHGSIVHPGKRWVSRPFSWDWVEGRLIVDAVRDSLASGLRVGDEVLRIGPRTVAEVRADEASRISAASEGWLRSRIQSGRGGLLAEVDSLDLEVRDARDLARRVRVGPGPASGVVAPARPDTIAELRPGLWYVDLGRCQQAQFDARKDSLAAAKGVIFDMRGYPAGMMPGFLGHLSDSTLTSARWHVPNVPYPDGRGRTFQFSNWPVAPSKPRFAGRIAFVIDGRAISYAETCMGIVEHYRLGDLVGEPTAGTNGNIVRLPLPGRYQAIFTGMRVLKHDGSRHHGVGIRPTVPVSRTVAGIRAGRDELLERAIEVVSAGR